MASSGTPSPFPSSVAKRVGQLHDEYFDPESSAPWLFCDRHPQERTAFRFVDAELRVDDMTYGDLALRSRRAAYALAAHGVGPGDRVASLLGKGPDLPALILGIWRIGAVYVPVFTAFAAAAVVERLEAAGVSVVVTDATQREKLNDAPVTVLMANTEDSSDVADSSDFGRALRSGEEWAGDTPVRGPGTPIVQMATSGTTGKPKAVVHPLAYAAGWQSYVEFGIAPSEQFWCGADPGWAYGLYTVMVGPLSAGIPSIVTHGAFKPDLAWRVLRELNVTDYAAAPTALRALRAYDPGGDLPALKRISTAGEPLTPDIGEWTRDRFSLDVRDHFGQTELGMTAGFAHHLELQRPVAPLAMGQSLPGWSMTVLDARSDEPAPTGQIGRLAVRVMDSEYFTFSGYGAGRDNRGDRFTADGVHYLTGDLASVGEDGLIRFSCRDDDVILMAGYRIGPVDIESVLLTHSGVAECAVVGTPDEARGEVVHAFVVPRESTADAEAFTSELQDWVRTHYAAHAYPRIVTLVDELPKTPSGKIQRAVLRRADRPDGATR